MSQGDRERVEDRSKAVLLKEYQIKTAQAEQEQSGNETWPLQGLLHMLHSSIRFSCLLL